jgi:hypothetical protein
VPANVHGYAEGRGGVPQGRVRRQVRRELRVEIANYANRDSPLHAPIVTSPAETAEAVRIRRLREDARRPIGVNLAEGIALSHKLMRFTGAARNS